MALGVKEQKNRLKNQPGKSGRLVVENRLSYVCLRGDEVVIEELSLIYLGVYSAQENLSTEEYPPEAGARFSSQDELARRAGCVKS